MKNMRNFTFLICFVVTITLVQVYPVNAIEGSLGNLEINLEQTLGDNIQITSALGMANTIARDFVSFASNKRRTTTTYTIISVTSLSDLSVDYNTPLSQVSFPSTVSVVASDSKTYSMTVTWDTETVTYTPNIPGTYTFTGTISETTTIKNTSGLTASINVVVNNPETEATSSYIENNDPNPNTSLNVSDGTILYEFDSASEWVENTQVNVTLDTNNASSGTGYAFLQPNTPIDISGVNVSYYTFQTSVDLGDKLSDNKVIEINIYRPMSTDISYMLLRFHTDTSGYSFFETAIGLWELSPGWNKIRRTVDDFNYVNWADSTLTATWDSITTMDFIAAYPTGGSGTIGIDKVSVNPIGKARILFTFDDAWQDVYDNAYPILEAKGFDATTWVIKDAVEESWNSDLSASMDFMGVTELTTLYNSGWDLGNHTTNHPDDISTLSDTELLTIYGENMNWLIEQGWQRGAYHVCYPSGQYSDHLISLLQSLGVKTGRTTVYGMEPANVSNIYKLKTVAVGRDSQIEQYVIGEIDNAIATGSTLIFMFHRVEDVPESASDFADGTDYGQIAVSTSVFQYIVDHVDAYVQTGEAEVVTISEWYEEYMTSGQ